MKSSIDIKCFSMHHVDKWGIGKVVEMALEYVGKDRPIHLSFDIGKEPFHSSLGTVPDLPC